MVWTGYELSGDEQSRGRWSGQAVGRVGWGGGGGRYGLGRTVMEVYILHMCEQPKGEWSGFHHTAGEHVAVCAHLSEAESSLSPLLASDVGSFFTSVLHNNKSHHITVCWI